MKRLAIPLFVAVLLLSGLIGVSQTYADSVIQPVLTYVFAADATDQLPEVGLTVYAHVNNAGGAGWLVGAEPSGLDALAAAGLPFQELEPVLEEADGAAYYLAYTMPGQDELDWAGYGRVLLVEHDWRLIRASVPEATGLSEAGVQLQRMTLDPKPFSPSFIPSYPTLIDPDPLVQAMMDQVYSDTVYLYDGNLSGEWPVNIGGDPYTILTRNTNSGEPIQKATQFVGEHFEDLGLDVEFHQWGGATYPNVIGEITGLTNPEEIYIVSAHLDDMPSSGPAPGADDNASGTVAALIAADIFSQYEWGCTIRFGLWTGEEQGLNGSYAYAQRSYNAGENIAGVLNLDMIAWNTPNSSRDIDLHATSNIPSTIALAQLFADVVDVYNLDLIPQINPNGSGSSDHASFWQFGYTAILGIEDFGDFNPYYHSSNDRLANVDLDYFTEFVRASIGSFAHMSDCVLPVGGEPDIEVEPTSIGSAQETNTVTVHPVDISNLGDETLDWSIFEDGSVGANPEVLWSDNFDSYAIGTWLHGVGGWKGWGNDTNYAAATTDVQSFSAPAAVDIVGDSDLVHEYSGVNSGQWVYSTMQYVPSDMTGLSYFLLLNSYDDAGLTNNWSTQISFDAVNGVVTSEFENAQLPLITDQWVELRAEIDLDTDWQTIFYDGQVLSAKSWTEGVSGGGALNVGAVDLFANGSSSVYYDDMSLEQATSACDTAQDIPWASVEPAMGSTAAGNTDTVNITLDSTGMLADTYVAALCVESNDPDEPLVVIDLEMIVEAPTDVSLSGIGSEMSAVMWPTLVLILAGAGVMIGLVARKRAR